MNENASLRPLTEKTAPKELIDLDVWMCWAHRGDGPNRTKVPMNAMTGGYGSSTDPQSWTDYETAMNAYRDHAPDFEGMAFAISYHLAVIDLDHCRDPETGAIEKWAQATIDEFDTYAEVSPSGTGVHIIMFAKDAEKITGTKFVLPQGGGRRVELYNQSHYFTFTGNPLPGHGGAVTEQSAAFEKLRQRIAAAQEKARNAPKRSGPARRSGPVSPHGNNDAMSPHGNSRGASGLTDDEVLKVAYASAHGETIKRLMDGDQSDYRNDWSSADMALAGFLAFYTGKDADQIDRIFRTSGLMRDKWDSKRAGSTYGWFTIDKAIDGTADSYSPGGEEFRLGRPKRLLTVQAAEALPPYLTRASDVSPTAVSWLWQRWLVQGAINVLDGDAGLGKSQLVALIAAHVTHGAPWPDQTPAPLGNVLIIGGEDSISQTWVPRLKFAGANLDRVWFLNEKPGSSDLLTIPDDIDLLASLVVDNQIAFIAFDPIVPYLSEDVNPNSDKETRRALTPLALMLQRTDTTGLLLRHLNKNDKVTSALYRGGGSVAFTAIARSSLIVANAKNEPDTFLLMVNKMNLARKPRARKYHVEEGQVSGQGGISLATSRVVIDEESDARADEVLTAFGAIGKTKEVAEDLVERMLSTGPLEAERLYRMLKDQHVGRSTADRAMRNLSVGFRRRGFGPKSVVFRFLPEHEHMVTEVRELPEGHVPTGDWNLDNDD